MTIKFENGVLTVNTGIPATMLKKGAAATVKDDKGNDVFYVEHGSRFVGTEDGLVCNQVIDGCLAAVAVFPEETTIDSIKEMYGDAMLVAAKYIPQLVAQINDHAQKLAELFQ